MAVDKEILEDFQGESKGLVEEMMGLLEEADGEPSQYPKLEHYGQIVDRIMGGAKSLATNFASDFPPGHLIHQMGDYAALCKAVGYKASQVHDNEQFFNVSVAFLLDATDMLHQMVDLLTSEQSHSVSTLLNKTFLDRLKWINAQFKGDLRATVASKQDAPKKMSQTDIDDLLKKLGIG
jgi:chemotaxis protein histidine kinase CheA